MRLRNESFFGPPPPLPVMDTSALDSAVGEQIESARRAVERDPENPRRNGELGMLCHCYREYSAAETCYLRACAFNPHSFRWHYLLGLVLSRQGKVDRAAEVLEYTANLKPDYYAALIKLGELCIERGELEEGEQKFKRVLETEPDNAPAHAGLGRAASIRRDDAAAAKHYETALADESGKQAHYALAMAYRRIGRIAEAEEQLKLSEEANGELSSNDPLMVAVQRLEIGGSFVFRQGLDRLAERNLEQAMIHFQNVLRVKPEMAADAHYCIGNIRIRQGEPDLAIHQYEQALALRPKYHGAWSNLGTAYMKKREYAKAAECFGREIGLRPREPQAHANLGKALEHLGRVDDAIEQYLKAVEFDMSSPMAQRGLASALSKANRHEEAIPHWKEYLRIEPGDASAMTSLAESLRAVVRPEDALQLEENVRASATDASTDPSPSPPPR